MENNEVHLWIGSNHEPEEKYLKYFELNYSDSVSVDDENYQVCQFRKDVGIRWYDDDFIGIIPRFDKEVSLDLILEEAAIDRDQYENVKNICFNLGITKANAMFWYQDDELEIEKPYKKNYNGLKYIGKFEGD